eukprot:13118823-Alexandrium_andersonii.AAC.1
MTSDGGSDEVVSRQVAHAELSRYPQHWMFDNDCMMHIYQLLVEKQLDLLNKFFFHRCGVKFAPLLSK